MTFGCCWLAIETISSSRVVFSAPKHCDQYFMVIFFCFFIVVPSRAQRIECGIDCDVEERWQSRQTRLHTIHPLIKTAPHSGCTILEVALHLHHHHLSCYELLLLRSDKHLCITSQQQSPSADESVKSVFPFPPFIITTKTGSSLFSEFFLVFLFNHN